MKNIVLLTASFLFFTVYSQTFVWNGSNGFPGFDRGTQCTVAINDDGLTLTDIQYDPKVFFTGLKMPSSGLDRFSFRYRATGFKRTHGGELFYRGAAQPAFNGKSVWRIPELVVDGQWHEITLKAEERVRDFADWQSAGNIIAFRFDPVNYAGEKLEISSFKFYSSKDPIVERKADARKTVRPTVNLDYADVWPMVTPEFTKLGVYGEVSSSQVGLGATISKSHATGGETVRLTFDFQGASPDFPLSGRLRMEDTRDHFQLWKGSRAFTPADIIYREPGKWALSFDFTLPLYACLDGEVELSLDLTGASIDAGKRPAIRFKTSRAKGDPKYPTPIVATVQPNGRNPYFKVNGEPFFPLWGAVQTRGRSDGRWRHSPAPLNLVTAYNDVSIWWSSEKVTNFRDFDRMAQIFLDENPDAYFMWNLSIYPPNDWCEANPDEMCQTQEGEIVRDGRPSFSLASKKALDAMEKVMIDAIKYVEASPYANRVIGYRVNSGHTIEWLGWDPPNHKTTLDFSPAAQRGFEVWAKAHYPALTSWEVPKLLERRVDLREQKAIWNPLEHQKVVAYHDFLSTVTADDVIRMCSKAKELVNHKKLIGTYYGYVMTLWSGGDNHIRSHFSTKKVLDAGAVDFLISPQPYGVRALGDINGEMKPFTSIAVNNIVPIIEDDARTHHSTYLLDSNNRQTHTEFQTLGVERRNMGFAICRGQPLHHYALCAGTELDFEAWARDAASAKKAGEICLKTGAKRNAEIAVVVSEEVMKAMPMLYGVGQHSGEFKQDYLREGTVNTWETDSRPLCGDLYLRFYERIGRVGAPVDYLLAEDLVDHPGEYKLYIFQNAYRADKKMVALAEKLRSRNCTIVWISAPGYIGEKTLSTASMKTLTGMDFIELSGKANPAAKMKVDGRVMGPRDGKFSPVFALAEADETLGTLADGSIGVGIKHTGKAKSVFISSYQVDYKLLRSLAEKAGVFLYSDTSDPLEANSHLVTLHARSAGKKTIHLPSKSDVYDVFARQIIARGVTEFNFTSPLHASYLFLIRPAAHSLP